MKVVGRALLATPLAVFVVAVAALGAVQGAHLLRRGEYRIVAPVCRVLTDRSIIALSFDDGPDPDYTSKILPLLERYEQRATFFLIGRRAARFSQLMSQEVDAGMEIGNHTWSHPHLPELSADRVGVEVRRTSEVLSAQGLVARLFRAPYGEITREQLAMMQSMGLTTIHWSLALDRYLLDLGNPRNTASSLARDVRPGDIVLAHDATPLARDGGGGRATTIETLELLLPALKQRGFELTTVGDLLTEGSVVRAKPRFWFWQKGYTCPNG